MLVCLAFTGSRTGPTPEQAAAVAELLAGRLTPEYAVHGAYVGADEGFAAACAEAGVRCEARPSDMPRLVSGRAVELAAKVYPPDDPVRRNRKLVAEADHLLACPDGPERDRSGTWMTVRRARIKGIPVTIVWPPGHVEDEPGNGYPD